MDSNEVRQNIRFIGHLVSRYKFHNTVPYEEQLMHIVDFFFSHDKLFKSEGEYELPADLTRIPAYLAPDICGTCMRLFGRIINGQIRAGCCYCQDRRRNRLGDSYYVNRIAYRIGVSYEVVQAEFAQVLYESRKPASTISSQSETTISQQQNDSAQLSEKVSPAQADASTAAGNDH